MSPIAQCQETPMSPIAQCQETPHPFECHAHARACTLLVSVLQSLCGVV